MRKAWFRVSDDDVESGDELPSSDCPCCGRPTPFVLGVSRPTVVRLMQTGWMNGAKRGHYWRVNLDEVVRVLTLEATRRSQALDEVVRSRRNSHDASSCDSSA